MKRILAIAFVVLMCAFKVEAASRTLAWIDTSTTETGMLVESCPGDCSATGTWTVVANLAANVTAFSVSNIVPLSKTSYRIAAFNATGKAYSFVLVWTEPLDLPNAPTGMTFNCPAGMTFTQVVTGTKIDATCK